MSTIIIKKSTIASNNNLYRMNTEIVENGKRYNLFAEVEKEFSQYLTPELADNLVYLCLPVALREGYDIICETPVSSMFLHNINEILIPHLVMGDPRLKTIKVIAPSSDLQFYGKGVGTAISCGVDSTYTVMKYSGNEQSIIPDDTTCEACHDKTNYQNYMNHFNLTHLFITSSSIDLWDSAEDSDLYKWVNDHKTYFKRYEEFAKDLNLPLVKVWSNYCHYICLNRSIRSKRISHLHTHHYITLANVLAVKKLWSVYLFSSTTPYTIFDLQDNSTQDTKKHELLSMHTLNIPGFFCFSGGVDKNRVKKLLQLQIILLHKNIFTLALQKKKRIVVGQNAQNV